MFPFALTDVDCLLEQMSMQIVLLGNKYNILMKKKTSRDLYPIKTQRCELI